MSCEPRGPSVVMLSCTARTNRIMLVCSYRSLKLDMVVRDEMGNILNPLRTPILQLYENHAATTKHIKNKGVSTYIRFSFGPHDRGILKTCLRVLFSFAYRLLGCTKRRSIRSTMGLVTTSICPWKTETGRRYCTTWTWWRKSPSRKSYRPATWRVIFTRCCWTGSFRGEVCRVRWR